MTLLVQAAAAPPVVAALVAARLNADPCQPAEPPQYLPSEERCRVKVAPLASRPAPPLLSATLPLKVAGRVLALYERLPAGAVTEAVAGAVLSSVKLTAAPVKLLPTASVAVAWTV